MKERDEVNRYTPLAVNVVICFDVKLKLDSDYYILKGPSEIICKLSDSGIYVLSLSARLG